MKNLENGWHAIGSVDYQTLLLLLGLFLVIEGQQAFRSFYIYSKDHEKRKYLYLGMFLTAVCIFNLIVYVNAVF